MTKTRKPTRLIVLEFVVDGEPCAEIFDVDQTPEALLGSYGLQNLQRLYQHLTDPNCSDDLHDAAYDLLANYIDETNGPCRAEVSTRSLTPNNPIRMKTAEAFLLHIQQQEHLQLTYVEPDGSYLQVEYEREGFPGFTFETVISINEDGLATSDNDKPLRPRDL